MVDLRSGIPVAQEELQTLTGRIAQALTGSFPLQQYEVLAALLASLATRCPGKRLSEPS